jgi:hypothetical protein
MIEFDEAKAKIAGVCGYGVDEQGRWICGNTKAYEAVRNDAWRMNCCASCRQEIKDECTKDNQPVACLTFCCDWLGRKIVKDEALLEAWGVIQIEALRRKKGMF